MKLEPWEPDLQTLSIRIDNDELNLQPDFQRGLAWSGPKQQRLIDTVLRGWSVPAVHLIVEHDERLSVLDGQQRLRSLKMFLDDEIAVNGHFEPTDAKLADLHGAYFSDLSIEIQRRVRNTKVMAYRLYDFEPDEPHELFFRLNLPTGLTQAEKRNALVGKSHEKVKSLVTHAVKRRKWDKDLVGFSNARLAYDDSFARVATFVEGGTVRQSATSGALEEVYRRDDGLSATTISTVRGAIDRVTDALDDSPVRLNKATLVTWLLVAARYETDSALAESAPPLGELLQMLEVSRVALRRGHPSDVADEFSSPLSVYYLDLFNDRASSRVTDVLSVVARDAVVWRLACEISPGVAGLEPLKTLREGLAPIDADPQNFSGRVLDALDDPTLWGTLR